MDDALIGQLGALISRHPLFPEETNVGFMQVLTASSIALRVYERGCGETEACGSGAVAAAAIGMLYYGLEDTISVTLPGGILHVHWPQKTGPIFLTGPATLVYDGQLLDM